MSKLLLVFLLFSAFSLNAQIDYDEEFMNGSTLMLSENMVLVYEVDYYGTHYDFIVTIKSFNDGISFSYEMTNEAKTKGSISISQTDFENSLVQHNYFSGGHLDLDGKTSVWVSLMVFNQLISNGECRISQDGVNYVSLQNAQAKHDYNILNENSEEELNDISYIYAESDDGSTKYWIHMSKYQPLILKMDLGWKIWLKEIR